MTWHGFLAATYDSERFQNNELLKTTFDKFYPNEEKELTLEGVHKALVEMVDDNQIDINQVTAKMFHLVSSLNFEVFGPTLDGIRFSTIEDFVNHDIFSHQILP